MCSGGFFCVFLLKPLTNNNHQSELCDISNDIKKIPNSFPSVQKNLLEFFDFLFILEPVQRASRLTIAYSNCLQVSNGSI